MLNKESESLLSKLLLVGPALVTLLVFTTGVTDPVNVNKLLALGIVSCSAIAILTVKSYRFIWVQHKFLVLALFGFLLASINSIIQSNSPITQQLYGVYGRNNGFLLYLFLVLIFVTTLSISEKLTFRNLVLSLVIAGAVNIVYCGWVIAFGDFVGWTNPYGNILGTFGNPNFIGAFLGMFSSVLITLTLVNFRNRRIFFLLILTLGITIFEILNSNAIQGRVLFVVGLVINGFFFIRSRFRSRIPIATFSLMSAVGGVAGLLGALQIGPLTEFIYKDSVSLRGEYWNAGLNMGRSHLFSGVGFDSYGDWYRFSRRASSLVRPGPETVSNTAHNVVIDIFAFGGLPLLISYLAIMGFVIFSIIRFALKNREFDYVFVSLVGAWLCFQLQSIISINQIGLAVWGWVLGAAIVSYERVSRRVIAPDPKTSKPIRPTRSTVISPNLRAGIAIVLATLIAVPPFAADVKWRSAQLSLDAAKLEEALAPGYFNPLNTLKYLQIVGAFEESNLTDLAHKYAVEAVEFNPHSYDSWRLFTLIRSTRPEELQIALSKMKELDPKNPRIVAVAK
jgi:O-antigen ligase